MSYPHTKNKNYLIFARMMERMTSTPLKTVGMSTSSFLEVRQAFFSDSVQALIADMYNDVGGWIFDNFDIADMFMWDKTVEERLWSRHHEKLLKLVEHKGLHASGAKAKIEALFYRRINSSYLLYSVDKDKDIVLSRNIALYRPIIEPLLYNVKDIISLVTWYQIQPQGVAYNYYQMVLPQGENIPLDFCSRCDAVVNNAHEKQTCDCTTLQYRGTY
ncbi:MAG: hypothetical protein GY941_11960 [Planctomycetes bacterium]|nr:hypothetical protein [Planctomycetota bacterium]